MSQPRILRCGIASWSFIAVSAMFGATLLFAEAESPDRVTIDVVRGLPGYQLVGVSAEQVESDAGLGAMHAACQVDFGREARMCTTVEAANSPELARLELQGVARLAPVIVAATLAVNQSDFTMAGNFDQSGAFTAAGSGGLLLAAPSMDCRGWTDATSDSSFAALWSGGAPTPTIRTIQCQNTPTAVACCAPWSPE